MNTYVPMLTKKGQHKIQKEYDYLVSKYKEVTAELRQKSGEALDDAYSISTKKIEQLFLENKIKKIQNIMYRMHPVKRARSHTNKHADVGSKVIYQHGTAKRAITLVDPLEADPSAGFIPIDSPLGKAIVTGKINEKISVMAPRQTYEIKLLKIS